MLPFKLDILPLDKMIAVEKAIPSRVSLIKKELSRTGHQATPLLVVRHETEGYFLLNGINCFQALKEMGITSAVVQDAGGEAPSVRFLSWYHLVRNCKPEYIRQIASNQRLEIERVEGSPEYGRHYTSKKIDCLMFNGGLLRLTPQAGDLHNQAIAINAFIESYQSFSPYLKIYPDKVFIESAELFDLGTVLIALPSYSWGEIRTLSRGGILFPPNCLNVAMDNRVIGLDFPLKVLKSQAEIDEKREFLRQLILLRMRSDRSTVFGGRVYFLGRLHGDLPRSSRDESRENMGTDALME
jgi:hypothetical protein